MGYSRAKRLLAYFAFRCEGDQPAVPERVIQANQAEKSASRCADISF
jgi:hypothetical protein